MNILYICTHNRCRSVLSEAITNKRANGKIVAKSAGSQPAGEVHPLTLKYLKLAGYSIEGLISNSWEDINSVNQELFHPDLVVTVCDSASGESCPLWLDTTPKIHWGLSDPSKLVNNMSENDNESLGIEKAFKTVISTIEERVDNLIMIADMDISMEEKLVKVKCLIS